MLWVLETDSLGILANILNLSKLCSVWCCFNRLWIYHCILVIIDILHLLNAVNLNTVMQCQQYKKERSLFYQLLLLSIW